MLADASLHLSRAGRPGRPQPTVSSAILMFEPTGTSSTERLVLRPLTEADQAQALQAHRELAAEDFTFLLDWTLERTWPQHLRLLRQYRHGLELAPGHVPATFLVALADGDLVGRVSVRHELNSFLAELGGHIGYAVRPPFRGRGHATEILRQALIVASAESVERALVTCDDTNAASRRVIERCGGVLEDVRRTESGGTTRRYWIG